MTVEGQVEVSGAVQMLGMMLGVVITVRGQVVAAMEAVVATACSWVLDTYGIMEEGQRVLVGMGLI
jgi:hypothetical protein